MKANNPSSEVWDVESIRSSFPLLSRKIGKYPVVYFDNAASLQRSSRVLERLKSFTETSYSNVHRALHRLGQESTEAFENSRESIRKYISANSSRELIFTSGTTASINLVMRSWAWENIQAGDEILISRMEHHSNWVPWQWLCQQKSAVLKIAELDENVRLDLDDFRSKLSSKTKLVALSASSNVLGLRPALGELCAAAKDKGAMVLLDAAQAMAHAETELLELPADFVAFSSHKMGGPGGVGALWAKEETLEAMSPVNFGGEMVSEVSEEKVSWNALPYKFEAGTPAIAEAVGFGEAVRAFEDWGSSKIQAYESELCAYALEKLLSIDTLNLMGPRTPEDRLPIFSFQLEGVHPQDLAQYLDSKGVCIRTGLHCAEPLHRKLGFESSARISLSFYNTKEEIDFVVDLLKRAKGFFGS